MARGSLVAASPMPHPYVMIVRPAARHRPGTKLIWHHLLAPGMPPQSAAFKQKPCQGHPAGSVAPVPCTL
jgi:hypothetical protein